MPDKAKSTASDLGHCKECGGSAIHRYGCSKDGSVVGAGGDDARSTEEITASLARALEALQPAASVCRMELARIEAQAVALARRLRAYLATTVCGGSAQGARAHADTLLSDFRHRFGDDR